MKQIIFKNGDYMSDIQLAILKCLLIHDKGIDRAELCKNTNLPRTTVRNNIDTLISYNIIKQYVGNRPIKLRGRQRVLFKLTPDYKTYIEEIDI